MVFAIDTDGDSQRTPEWRSLSDLDLGPKNQPVLIKVAQRANDEAVRKKYEDIYQTLQ